MMNGPCKTILPLYHNDRAVLSSASQKTLTMNMQSQAFPVITEKQPFQGHPATQTTESTQSSVSQGPEQ